MKDAKKWVSRILGGNYDEVFFQDVNTSTKSAQLGIASRFGSVYSENNMGFGEGRVVHTIKLLETCPEKSLVVLEEPETSLHEFAQHEFTKYLMDVSYRRGHQIVFSTHSSVMMNALPSEGRKLLSRGPDGVQVYDRISSSRIKTALTAGENGHAIICVEDIFAKSLLIELLRRADKNLLSSLNVIEFGDAKAVVSATTVLRRAGQKAIAVRDADQVDDVTKGILKLPGSLPPEKEIFLSAKAKSLLLSEYGFDLDAAIAADPEMDHHNYSRNAALKTSTSREVLESDCIRAFLDAEGPDWASQLIEQIKNALAS